MEFLTPLFWLGATVLTIPILLHLVQKENTRKIPFSSVMFIPRLPIKQLRRRRLENLLLLFLRCLGILLLVAAFTRPVVNADWLGRIASPSARSVVVLLDNSLSMSPGRVWDRAMEAARRKIESLGDSDEGLLMQFGQSAEALTRWETGRPALLEALNNRARRSFESTSYLEALRVAADQFDETRRETKEIYLITDLQRNGLSSTQGWKVPADILFDIEDVGAEDSNLFVEEARVERNLYSKEYQEPILVRVSSRPARASSGQARLFLDGKAVDQQSFQVDEQGTAQLTFKPFELSEGISKGRILLEPEDDIPADNAFHFVIQRREPSRILLVSENDQKSLFYLRKALTTGRNLPYQVDTVRNLTGELDPGQTPLVILNDPKSPPSPSLLKAYVENGGGLILLLGANTRSEAYSGEWSSWLPARLGERHFVRSKQKPFNSVTQISWEHPIFSIFKDIHQASVVGTQFYVYWKVAPTEGSSVIARFSEGDPALVEKSAGLGKVLLLTSAPDPVWTDFPLRASFLPFWYRAVRYAADWGTAPAALRIGQVISAATRNGDGEAGTWTVVDPNGTRVQGIDQTATDTIPLKIPGFYEIRENKGTNWVAVNTPPEESDLTRTSEEDFLAIFVPAQSRTGTAGDSSQATAAQEHRQSLWWLFLAAAAAVLFLESLVASRRKSMAPG